MSKETQEFFDYIERNFEFGCLPLSYLKAVQAIKMLEADAERYQFLKSCKNLTLSSQKPTKWFREDGSDFTSTYYLACNDTSFPGFQTLDDLVDFAMNLEK